MCTFGEMEIEVSQGAELRASATTLLEFQYVAVLLVRISTLGAKAF